MWEKGKDQRPGGGIFEKDEDLLRESEEVLDLWRMRCASERLYHPIVVSKHEIMSWGKPWELGLEEKGEKSRMRMR
jgi:hypothetical protein